VFAGRSYDQIRNGVCYPKLNVKLGFSHAGITLGEDGGSHQAIEDIALMRVLPNMTVFVPSDATECYKCVEAAAKINGPVFIRTARLPSPVYEERPFEVGKGNVIKDKDGYEVYFTEDGKIAYDKKKGTTAYVMNKDGQPETGEYTKEQLVEIKNEAKDILAQIGESEYEAFEVMMEKRGEDNDAQTYENGYYLSNDPANYASYPYLESIVKALNELEVGQTALVESDYGYHVVMRYPCPEGAYTEEENKDWFEGFTEGLIEDMFTSLCATYADRVQIDQAVLDTVPSMYHIGKNYYY
jgi:hypothetical protein